jgi:hypothetical protein
MRHRGAAPERVATLRAERQRCGTADAGYMAEKVQAPERRRALSEAAARVWCTGATPLRFAPRCAMLEDDGCSCVRPRSPADWVSRPFSQAGDRELFDEDRQQALVTCTGNPPPE